MIIKNHLYIFLSVASKLFGRGKYFRKKLFSPRRILEKNFPQESTFHFLQVGANDGISFDFLYRFVIKRKSSGVVIEPIKEYYDELCENYKSQTAIIKINKAVNRDRGIEVIYKIDKSKTNLYPDWVKGIASFDINNLTKFDNINRDHILEEMVVAEPLMDILKDSNISSFDYFQVDTEGYDYHVVDMFDFSIYKPKMVKAEYINLKFEEKNKIKNKLKNNGYYVFFQGLDIVGIDLKKIKL